MLYCVVQMVRACIMRFLTHAAEAEMLLLVMHGAQSQFAVARITQRGPPESEKSRRCAHQLNAGRYN
jgi:hypothetical protein